MANDPKPPRTHEVYSAEDKAKALKAFTKAHDNAPAPEKIPGQGSDMVKNTKPLPAPKPPGSTRAQVERTSYQGKLEAEQQKAQNYNREQRDRILNDLKKQKSGNRKEHDVKSKYDDDKGK